MTITAGASVIGISGQAPQLDRSSFVATGARLIGDVHLGAWSSIWYNAVVRGDGDSVVIGEGSNVQDNATIHVDHGRPTTIGRNVSIGHNAVVHGCTIEDGCLIGMGSVILSGATIGAGSLVAAGSVVLEGTVVPPGSLVAGVPGAVRRSLSESERRRLTQNADTYRALVNRHAQVDRLQ